MKKESGFTLIELLAVIVILAVIALIATPIIMNVIDNAKKGASQNSMYGYVEAVELESVKTLLSKKNSLTGTYTTKDGNLYLNSDMVLEVSFKGNKPDDGGVVELVNGMVKKAELIFNGNLISYVGNIVEKTPEPEPTYQFAFEDSGSGTGSFFQLRKPEPNVVVFQGIGLTPGGNVTGNLEITGNFKANQEYKIKYDVLRYPTVQFNIGIDTDGLTVTSHNPFTFTPKNDMTKVILYIDMASNKIETDDYLKITVQ